MRGAVKGIEGRRRPGGDNRRVSWATYAGLISGLAGTAATIAAFAWPAA